MVELTKGAKSFKTDVANFAGAFGNMFKTAGAKVFGITTQAGGMANSTVGNAARTGGSLLDKALATAGKGLRPATWAMNKMPVIGAGVAIATGALAVRGHYNKKREQAANEFQARQQLSHMAVTSPHEYALMMERMRGSNPKDAPGFVQTEMKRRDDMAQAGKQ
jgi:hypothetical protein